MTVMGGREYGKKRQIGIWGERKKGSREERNVGIWEKGNVRLKGVLEGKEYGRIWDREFRNAVGEKGDMEKEGIWECGKRRKEM